MISDDKISKYEINMLCRIFPKFKPNYEKLISNLQSLTNKSNKIYFAIPKGKKCYLWFYYFEGKYLSLLVFEHNNRFLIEPIICNFNEILCYGLGTILYGSLINITSNSKIEMSYFTFYDIFKYSNTNVANLKYANKLELFTYIFNTDIINNNCLNINCNKHVIISLPLLDYSYQLLIDKIKLVKYDIDYILINDLETNFSNKIYYCEYDYFIKNKNNNIENNNIIKYLTVYQFNKNDIYHLYNKTNFIDNAFIPNYKTSSYMNTIFNTKHNANNLDLIEESDDENDEPEQMRIKNGIEMKCLYISKINKYIPLCKI
jgi:hypothetical protein